ncbi:BPS2 protein-like protein [Sulfolobus islandicus Y.G.57.14]|uniref:BPS2 protein-like protein n=7 Tax=Saccharolobus islandicus TaxID=43080 RepID=C3MJD2_SACI2|nr:SMC-like protein coalescin [Sulfolobus islandicus]ACP34210.1 BPS2 protein-like protein [Sulfolobus islandicus L.S.2.15]ACP36948.1 conserved hypothetical protein [Sulfolobus islandicus M.14.25]ACP44350.1 BPS2 protein-like protein [Sulfolobus islandicus Y.G.57.14]ACP54085.1 conserved hypothetical protein [Sulfolobus islandicus M.16.27]ACR40692.1 BPS2 protein-like protein [Sulfolobus islandicus M.16.4]
MKVRVFNIGGITQDYSLDLEKGVTSYEAPNAYGKTSLVRALISLLTSSIKAEDLLNVFADSGYIEVELDNKLYYRRIKRIKNGLSEDKNLIMDDDRALLLTYFSPENKLVTQILSGDGNVEWFISATSKINEIKAKKEELQKLLTAEINARDDLQKKYNNIREIQAKIRAIDEEIDKLEKERESSSNIVAKTTYTITLTRQNKINEIVNKIKVKKDELANLEFALKKIEEEIQNKESKVSPDIKTQLQKELEEINEKLKLKTSDRSELEIELKVLERVLEEVDESDKHHLDTCNVCGSKVDPSIWKERAEIISRELRDKTSLLDSLRNDIIGLQKRKEEIDLRLKEFQTLENEIAKLKAKKEELINRIGSVKFQIDDLERQKRETEERFNKSESLSGAIATSDDSTSILKRIEELRKKREEYEYELQLLGVPSSILEELKEKEEHIEQLQKKVDELQVEYIRRLTKAREEFNRISNQLLRKFEFDMEAEIDGNYRLIVRRKGAIIDIKKLSSSERTTLALILVLSALRAYFKTPYFIIDESAMTFDQKRFNRLLEYLTEIADYVIVTRSSENTEIKTLPPKQIEISS